VRIEKAGDGIYTKSWKNRREIEYESYNNFLISRGAIHNIPGISTGKT
jgi:hypothetical protein